MTCKWHTEGLTIAFDCRQVATVSQLMMQQQTSVPLSQLEAMSAEIQEYARKTTEAQKEAVAIRKDYEGLCIELLLMKPLCVQLGFSH